MVKCITVSDTLGVSRHETHQVYMHYIQSTYIILTECEMHN